MEIYEVNNSAEAVWSDDLLGDILNGTLAPADFLKYNSDIEEVETAIEIIKKYIDTLEATDLIEEA
jgi:hypothetical protein